MEFISKNFDGEKGPLLGVENAVYVTIVFIVFIFPVVMKFYFDVYWRILSISSKNQKKALLGQVQQTEIKNNVLVISPYNFTLESNAKIMTIREMITNLTNPWLSKKTPKMYISLSLP